MNQPAEESWIPQIPIYLDGPNPRGHTWCAVCCILFMGQISADPMMRKFVRKQHDAQLAEGMRNCIVALPSEDESLPILQIAVTIAPSVYSAVPSPVCWTHIQPGHPATDEEKQQMRQSKQQKPQLIPGKDYGSPWRS